jgi:probable rRNA maturation factor
MTAAVHVQLTAGPGAPGPHVPDRPALRRLLARAVRAVLRHEQVAEAEVSVTLLDDAGIAELNHRFLGHDAPTDVISFPLYESGEAPVGDVYLGWEQAERQAAEAGISTAEELVRLTVHGTLHVLGHEHPDGADRVESEMWRVQEAIVADILAPRA